MNIPLGKLLSLNPELNFQWRKIYDDEYPQTINGVKTDYNVYASEIALSVPIMFQYRAIANQPRLRFSAGVQLDFPFLSEVKKKYIAEAGDYGEFDLCSALEAAGQTQCSYIPESRALDFGFALGTTYMFIKSIGADLRYVLGLTQIDEKNGIYNQLTLSLFWYF
jgi:hypothetical protein